MTSTEPNNLLASQHGLALRQPEDALQAIASGLPAIIFTTDEIDERFFDLSNGFAGEVLQKFVNYSFRVAIVLPGDHTVSERVTELAREHTNHPYVRFVGSVEAALDWLSHD